jgi:chemotaxis protein methyltransferase CheR
MQQLGCKDLSVYLLELDKSEKARRQCERMMTVSISRFFRDRKLWDILEKEILPQLIQGHRDKVEIWFAGCACGEEVYSLKILWENLMTSCIHLPKLGITATDMNPIYLQRAKAAIYPPSSLKEVPDPFRSTYFRKKAGRELYEVEISLRKGIIWQTHHLRSDPPGSQFHLIFLRNNLLTYYQDEFKRPAFERVMNCLSAGGFLIIGSHEKLPLERPDLLSLSSLSYVFKKRV